MHGINLLYSTSEYTTAFWKYISFKIIISFNLIGGKHIVTENVVGSTLNYAFILHLVLFHVN